jgi:hypothetical protein
MYIVRTEQGVMVAKIPNKAMWALDGSFNVENTPLGVRYRLTEDVVMDFPPAEAKLYFWKGFYLSLDK